MLHGKIVEQVSGFEIVGAVEDEVCCREQGFGIGGIEVGDLRFNGDIRIECLDLSRGGKRLGQRLGGVGFIEQHLALQVARLNVIAVDEAQESNSGAGQHSRGCRSCSAAANENNS